MKLNIGHKICIFDVLIIDRIIYKSVFHLNLTMLLFLKRPSNLNLKHRNRYQQPNLKTTIFPAFLLNFCGYIFYMHATDICTDMQAYASFYG